MLCECAQKKQLDTFRTHPVSLSTLILDLGGDVTLCQIWAL